MTDPSYRARSAILGSIVGDALGATFEFQKSVDVKQFISFYREFRNGLIGGGPHRLSPGQFTDDTEMMLANMSVIADAKKYDQKKVAMAYHQWYLSHPVDIGRTVCAAITNDSAAKMISVAKTTNVSSLSNGFLMRLPGLIALHHDKSHTELVDAIKQDVILTHGHPEATIISLIYGMMLRKAIQGASAEEIYQYGQVCTYLNLFGVADMKNSPLISTIYKSFENGSYPVNNIDKFQIGYVAHAFWLLLHCLKTHQSYREAILDVIGHGGDTDTNACIVGALMGALYPETVPKEWIESVMNFRHSTRFKEYPIANPNIWKTWLPTSLAVRE